jgi:hypothetical protein
LVFQICAQSRCAIHIFWFPVRVSVFALWACFLMKVSYEYQLLASASSLMWSVTALLVAQNRICFTLYFILHSSIQSTESQIWHQTHLSQSTFTTLHKTFICNIHSKGTYNTFTPICGSQ